MKNSLQNPSIHIGGPRTADLKPKPPPCWRKTAMYHGKSSPPGAGAKSRSARRHCQRFTSWSAATAVHGTGRRSVYLRPGRAYLAELVRPKQAQGGPRRRGGNRRRHGAVGGGAGERADGGGAARPARREAGSGGRGTVAGVDAARRSPWPRLLPGGGGSGGARMAFTYFLFFRTKNEGSVYKGENCTKNVRP